MSAPAAHDKSGSPNNFLVLAWAILMGLTALSWWLSGGHGLGLRLSAAAVLVVTFAKIFLVGNSFMELRHAAPALQAVFGGWCVVTCTVLVTLAIAW